MDPPTFYARTRTDKKDRPQLGDMRAHIEALYITGAKPTS